MSPYRIRTLRSARPAVVGGFRDDSTNGFLLGSSGKEEAGLITRMAQGGISYYATAHLGRRHL